MGKERFLKELGLPPEVVELGEARAEVIGGDGESENKRPGPPAEENTYAPKAELEAPQLIEESAEYPAEQPPAKEPATKSGEQHAEVEERQDTPAQIGEIEAEAVEGVTDREGDLGESAADESTPDSALFPGSKAVGELDPNKATLAAATVLPLSLPGTTKAWVWITVLVCLAIAGYFLLKWYFGKGEFTSLPEDAVKNSSGDPIRNFLDNY